MRRAFLLAAVLTALVVRTSAALPYPDGVYEHTEPPFPLPADYSFTLSREIAGIEHALGLRLCKVIGAYTAATLPAPVPIELDGCAPVAVVVDASAPGDCSVGGGSQVAFCRSNGFTWGSLGGGFADTNTATICADTPSHVTQMGNGSCIDLDGVYALIGHNHNGVYSPVSHNHDTVYALLSHNHDGSYSAIGHTHPGLYAALSHDHDSRYFTETELSTSDGNAPNTGSNRVHWDNLVGVPAGFVDGVDDSGAGGTSIILDLGDNGSNESTAIAEIATTGDTHTIFQESSPDKLLIRVNQPWPVADAATALVGPLTLCGAGNAPRGITTAGNASGCTSYVEPSLLSTPGTINLGTNPVDWTVQKNVPAGFADGVDDGASVALDLGDSGSNESTAITKIAVTGDTNTIFQESSPDKLLIRAGQRWPAADTATTASAFAVDPMGCGANEWMTDQAANGTAVCAGVSFGQITSGSATDAQVDNNITAGQFAADPNNCASGSVAAGVTANGTAEGCLDPLTQTEGDARYPLSTALATDDGTANQVGDLVAWTKIKLIPHVVIDAELGPQDSAGAGYRMIRIPN